MFDIKRWKKYVAKQEAAILGRLTCRVVPNSRGRCEKADVIHENCKMLAAIFRKRDNSDKLNSYKEEARKA